ncbi:MAG: hypothetical protein JOY70_08930, partial [Acidisphaera sp.]|nr:hypothetical protein [Acidisphaera sp.]
PALQVAISWDVRLFDHASSDLFEPATGMADTMRGSGHLFLASPDDDFRGHNYIVGHRFNRKMRGWRGFFISVIDTAPPAQNMITARAQGYAAFLMQEDDMPRVPGAARRTVSPDNAPRDNVVLDFAGRS